MRRCDCGNELDYAPIDVASCYSCRQRAEAVMRKACVVAEKAIERQLNTTIEYHSYTVRLWLEHSYSYRDYPLIETQSLEVYGPLNITHVELIERIDSSEWSIHSEECRLTLSEKESHVFNFSNVI